MTTMESINVLWYAAHKGHSSLAQWAEGEAAIILRCLSWPLLILITRNSITSSTSWQITKVTEEGKGKMFKPKLG